MARGRKRKDGRREPNGRASRKNGPDTVTETEARRNRETAVTARQRVHGLPMALAATVDGGDVLGRLALVGTAGDGITALQRDAGRLYEDIVRTYQRFIGIPPLTSGSRLDRTGGHDDRDGTDPDYIAAYERAKGRYVRARRCVLLTTDANAQMVLDGVVLDDVDMRSQTGTLRIALNALAHEFREDLVRQAA